MRWDWRALFALVLAFAVFAILISPFVPSPPTTVRSRVAPIALLIVFTLATLTLMPLGTAVLRLQASFSPHAGRELVDMTTARLC